MKKLLSFLLAAVVLMSASVVCAGAATAATSGKCGDGVNWSYKNATLTISGTGAMYDYGNLSDNLSPWVAYKDDIKKIVVKSGVTSIGAYAFYAEKGPTSAQLPSTLTEIGGHAFQNCSNLTTINFPKSITTINARAFSECVGLTSVTFPEDSQLTKLGEYAFCSCSNLESIYLPNSLTSAGHSTVRHCQNLIDIHIPENMTTIPRYFLDNANHLTSVTIPASVTKIGEGAFSYCNLLSDVALQASVKTLDNGSFRYCFGLTSIDLSSVNTIKTAAFYACRDLTSVILNDKVKIESGAFSYCPNLDPLKITQQPKSVTVTNVGDTAALTIEATGKDLKYDWYYQNSGETEWTKSICHTATYEFPVTGARYSRRLYCVVTDRYKRTVKSTTVNVTFANPKLKITTQPTDVKAAKVGDTVTVSIGVEGEGVKYTWRYINKGASTWTESTVHKATVNVAVTDARYGRRMQCIVKDKYNRTLYSDIITLTFDTGLRITQSPVDTEVENEGDTAKLKIVAEGKGKTYTWYYRNAGATKWVKSSVTSSSYSTAMSAARDGRQVYCIVKDKYGVSVATDPVTLTIKK